MDVISDLFHFAFICAVVVGPLLVVFSLVLGKDALIAGLSMIVVGNAICIGGYGMEPVFYLQWIGF